MKILFDFPNMSGGQPRSHLAHLKIIHEAGNEVLATIDRNYEELKKKTNGVKIIKTKNFDIQNFSNNIINIFRWLRICSCEKPDIIHAIGTTQYKFLAVISDWTGIPLVFSQAGGMAKYANIMPMKGKTAIVFSVENKKQLLNVGFSKKKIFVISNRVNAFAKSLKKYNRTDDCVKILSIGNIHGKTFKGLMAFLQFLEINALNFREKFKLQIVGKDISKNMIYKKIICQKIYKVNDTLRGIGSVEYLGWVEDIEKMIVGSDICIGKGRSVVQPAMMGKICFVISEAGILTMVKKESFQSLYEYNFSGRGKQIDNINDLIKAVNSEEVMKFFCDEARKARSIINDFYLSNKAIVHLKKVYNGEMSKYITPKKNIGAAIFRLFKIYYTKLLYRNRFIDL